MNVVRLPVASRLKSRDERLAVMAHALAHLDAIVAIYREIGSRPNPATILMMVASIMDDQELRKAAGLLAARADEAGPLPPPVEATPAELKSAG